MKPLNLLFTSAGRRDYLVDYFVKALDGRGSIHVGNSEPLCSAFTVGDAHVVTPPIHNNEYLPFIHDYCTQKKISAIIPLFDLDLPVLSAARNQFAMEGVQVLVPTPEVVKICNDKWHMVEFFRVSNFHVPKTYLNPKSAINAVKIGELTFPLIVKPRWGMGSVALMKANDEEELWLMFYWVRKHIFTTYLQFESAANPGACVLIQEYLLGTEYGLDVFNDLKGRHVVTVPKRKLAMRSGETDIAITEDCEVLSALGAHLSELTQHPGNLDVDVYFDGTKATILELNCRFGGGYPFSHAAGVNFPAAIVAWLCDKNPDPNWFRARSGVTSVKCIRPKVII